MGYGILWPGQIEERGFKMQDSSYCVFCKKSKVRVRFLPNYEKSKLPRFHVYAFCPVCKRHGEEFLIDVPPGEIEQKAKRAKENFFHRSQMC